MIVTLVEDKFAADEKLADRQQGTFGPPTAPGKRVDPAVVRAENGQHAVVLPVVGKAQHDPLSGNRRHGRASFQG